MRRMLLALTLLGLLALAPTTSVEAGAGPVLLVSDLSGANEVPPADPADEGFGAATLDPATGEVCYALSLFTIDPSEVMLAHIHEAAAGVNGPVVIDFNPAVNGLSNCVAADPGVVADVVASPADFYFNVHTGTFPGGAVRGQLGPSSGPAATELTATLDGANEVPPVDTEASGEATVEVDGEGLLCFDVTVRDIGPVVAGHIHEGVAGVDGPVVIDLQWSLFEGQGCVVADVTVADAVMADPGAFYVNIHTEANPDGEIRGQLQAPVGPTTTTTVTGSTAPDPASPRPTTGATSPAQAVRTQPNVTG